MTRFASLAFILITFGSAAPCLAQAPSPREELLRHVPKDLGLCFVLNDLRGHAANWERSDWIKALKESALGQAFFAAPELKELLRFEQGLKKDLDIDWPTLRDDVLGDAVVFAYQPGSSSKPQDEQGVLLVHARRPGVLARLVDSLNRVQKASGEVESLQTRDHKGTKYVCRSGLRHAHYYLLSGALFAYTAKEELLKRVIDRHQAGDRDIPPLSGHLKKAGAANAVASLWIDPRAFDADREQKAAALPGPEAAFVKSFQKHWHALDAVVFSFAAQDNLEFKLSILAREKDLPPTARGLFTAPARPSDLWLRFPDDAILTMAARLDGTVLADALVNMAPPKAQQTFQQTLQPLAALAGIDLARDLAPNVGPDLGLCVLPATDPKNAPQVMAALAVRPGSKDLAIDQALYRGVHLLAGLALFDYNRRHPDDPIRTQTLKQDSVEVKYLSNDNLFPPGFQPACALKDGYLLLATSPDAIARFRLAAAPAPTGGETPLLRLSPQRLAKALREHRQSVIDHIAANNQVSKTAAVLKLDNILEALDLAQRIEITRGGGSGQASFVLRISPAKLR
jgi:hypothetical protein